MYEVTYTESRLEALATEAGVPYWALRSYLEVEVQRRRRERYSMHRRAHLALDRQLERVATAGDASETTPPPHQHSI